MLNLEKVNAILKNHKFCTYLSKINKLEENRQYCKHDLQHLLDVARIVYIKVLEENIHVKKEIIYAAALLHDIGRWQQYEEGISHELASVKLAKDILNECGFNNEEKILIVYFKICFIIVTKHVEIVLCVNLFQSVIGQMKRKTILLNIN